MAQREGVFLKVPGQVSSPDFHFHESSIFTPIFSEGRKLSLGVLGVGGKRGGSFPLR